MKKLLLIGALLVSVSAYAKMDVSSGEVVAGQWNYNFSQAKTMAETKKMPLLIFWASPGCGYCGLLEKAVQTDKFLTWQAEKKILMVFGRGTGGENGLCKEFVKSAPYLFPYVGVYWPKSNGTSVKELFCGRQKYLPVSSYSALVDCFIASVEKYIAGWSPDGAVSSSDSQAESTTGGTTDTTGGTTQDTTGGTTDSTTGGDSAGEACDSCEESETDEVVTTANPWKTQAYTGTLPLYSIQNGGVIQSVGSVDFSATTRGKVSAKCRIAGSPSLTISFSGTWGAQATDGSITLQATKSGKTFVARATHTGKLTVTLTGVSGYETLTSRRIVMTNPNFSNWAGVYTIAFPCADDMEPQVDSLGFCHATCRVTISSRKSVAKLTMFYPNTKSSTCSVYLAYDGEQVILPVTSLTSAYAISATAKVYTLTQKPNCNVIYPAEDSVGHFWHIKGDYLTDYACTLLGSYIKSGASRQEIYGSRGEVELVLDYLGDYSSYGTVKSYKSSQVVYKQSTGVLRGAMNLSFDRKTILSKYDVVALPGWPEYAAGCGCGWYKDSVNGKTIMRGFPVILK